MKITAFIAEISNDFVNLLFPRTCVNCQTPLIHNENFLCVKCILSLPKTNYHYLSDNPLDSKFVYEPKVLKVSSYLFFNKGGIAQRIIHEIKYKNTPELGIMIGQMYGRELVEMNWPVDILLPVPLHRTKLHRRGFNQSSKIAEGISRETGWLMDPDLVIRKKSTPTQTRKSKVERWQNVQSVYAITKSNVLSGKHIAVVDDVLTTGATIGEMISLLAQSGVKSIYILTLAAGK